MENEQQQDNSTPKPPKSGLPKGPKFNMQWIYMAAFAGLMGLWILGGGFGDKGTEISFQEFKQAYLEKNIVDKLTVINHDHVDVYIKAKSLNDEKYAPLKKKLKGDLKGPHFRFSIGNVEQFKAEYDAAFVANPAINKVEVRYKNNEGAWLNSLLTILLPFIVIIAIWVFMMRKMGGGPGGGGAGGGLFSIGKSKAKLFEKGTKVNVTFNDVAGLDEAKTEVMEIVDFLKHPKKYTALGGKIPKGCLLVGPPGTGKTLLAKAMAGEAQVPFYSMSGSDFVEMFVGVGASRVRDLFKQAREKSPCIIFIDEIDAIGRARGKNQMMSNDERENTLNQLLVEMDGFSGESGIIVVAATNRPDVLDTALLRPGRFDRQISIGIPDLKGREKIFKVHLGGIKTDPNLDVAKLASQTPGFAGADIANICNEAALIAARGGKDSVSLQDFNDAIDRVIGGLEKKNKIISPEEKKVIAYHEAGHAVSGWFLEHAHPLVKVTIVPRGEAALGYAQYLPKEKYLTLKEELEDQMCMTLGGRAVEEIVFGKISTGALSDLQQITRMAYSMVSVYGMTDVIGNVSFYDPQNDGGFQKPYSEKTGELIDGEVRKLIETAYIRVKKLLQERIKEVTIIAEQLLDKEVLYKDDMVELLGERPFEEFAQIPDLTANGNGETAENADEVIPTTTSSENTNSTNDA